MVRDARYNVRVTNLWVKRENQIQYTYHLGMSEWHAKIVCYELFKIGIIDYV